MASDLTGDAPERARISHDTAGGHIGTGACVARHRIGSVFTRSAAE